MPIIPELGRQKQGKDEFEASLSDIVKPVSKTTM
jgi:hypothetical protein